VRFGVVNRLVLVVVAVTAGTASAQEVATTCEGCARAESMLGADLEPMRAVLAKLVAGATLDESDIEMLRRHASYDDLARLACGVDASTCVDQARGAIDQALMPLPLPLPINDPGTCDPWTATTSSPALGFGAEVQTGWQDSALPTDHRAWGFGFDIRRRVTNGFALVGRFDRTKGRDAGVDLDGDGRDDDGTGGVSRLFALAGPSLRFAMRGRELPWFGQLDVLAGYTAMTSPGSEDGLVAGIDLSYQLAVLRVGVRALKGFGDADDARLLVVHIGPSFGAAPIVRYSGGCSWVETRAQPSRFGYGFDLALSGFGLGTGIGYMPPTVGLETSYAASRRVQPLARADLLVFLHGSKDHVLHQSLLGGLRVDLGSKDHLGNFSGLFVDLLAGYAWAAVTRPSTADSGAVTDVGIGYAIDDKDTVVRLRVHGRFGLAAENEDLRAVFVSMGVDLRATRELWH
jgi:hypothetical protein